jgi:DNA-binding response OmpR family regulator
MRDKEVFLLAPGEHSNNPGESHPTAQGSILVVEDDAPTLRLERVLLEEEGYSVEVVSSGEAAIEAITAKKPALVLLDIGLPGMDGFTTCQRIREISRVPVIMVTGRDCLDDKVRGMNVGADDYVTKPFLTHELAVRVKVLLRRSSIENAAFPHLNGYRPGQAQPADLTPQNSSNGAASNHSSETGHEPVSSEEVTSSQQECQGDDLDPPPADFSASSKTQETAPAYQDSQDEDLDSSPADTSALASSPEPAPAPGDSQGQNLDSPELNEPGPHTLPGAPPAPTTADDDAFYEGTVRLTVTTLGAVSHLINFVSELRQNSRFRLLRLVANQHKEGMDIWLGLREPLLLRSALGEVKGVSEVTVSPEVPSENEEPVFKVLLE